MGWDRFPQEVLRGILITFANVMNVPYGTLLQNDDMFLAERISCSAHAIIVNSVPRGTQCRFRNIDKTFRVERFVKICKYSQKGESGVCQDVAGRLDHCYEYDSSQVYVQDSYRSGLPDKWHSCPLSVILASFLLDLWALARPSTHFLLVGYGSVQGSSSSQEQDPRLGGRYGNRRIPYKIR